MPSLRISSNRRLLLWLSFTPAVAEAGGIHSDHLAIQVDQRSAAVTRIDGRAGSSDLSCACGRES